MLKLVVINCIFFALQLQLLEQSKFRNQSDERYQKNGTALKVPSRYANTSNRFRNCAAFRAARNAVPTCQRTRAVIRLWRSDNGWKMGRGSKEDNPPPNCKLMILVRPLVNAWWKHIAPLDMKGCVCTLWSCRYSLSLQRGCNMFLVFSLITRFYFDLSQASNQGKDCVF